MIKQIKIGVNEISFYKTYVGIINILYKIQLTKQQQYLLAELLYQNNRYRSATKEERNVMVFSTKSRKEMMTRLQVDEGTFNNNISIFRKQKGLLGTIIQNNELNENYIIYPDKDNELILKLIINYDTFTSTK